MMMKIKMMIMIELGQSFFVLKHSRLQPQTSIVVVRLSSGTSGSLVTDDAKRIKIHTHTFQKTEVEKVAASKSNQQFQRRAEQKQSKEQRQHRSKLA